MSHRQKTIKTCFIIVSNQENYLASQICFCDMLECITYTVTSGLYSTQQASTTVSIEHY